MSIESLIKNLGYFKSIRHSTGNYKFLGNAKIIWIGAFWGFPEPTKDFNILNISIKSEFLAMLLAETEHEAIDNNILYKQLKINKIT